MALSLHRPRTDFDAMGAGPLDETDILEIG